VDEPVSIWALEKWKLTKVKDNYQLAVRREQSINGNRSSSTKAKAYQVMTTTPDSKVNGNLELTSHLQ